MNFSKKTFFILLLSITLASCESILDGVNEDPNDIVAEEVSPELYLTGAQLANISAQAGHMNRITGMYSGQLVGLSSLYSNIYGFSLATSELSNIWSHIYVGSVTNLRLLRESTSDDNLLVGISKVVEAHAIGTAASVWGDIPYSEIGDPEISDPVFDGQVSVLNTVIDLLNEGIADLQAASSRPLDTDIIYDGNATKWIEAAYTLQARYHLQMKDYPAALNAAQNGISTDANTMNFIPRGESNVSEGDKNLFWQIIAGPRTGDIGTGNSYLMQLLSGGPDTASRENAKTNETARFGYYSINAGDATANQGVIAQFEPMPMVSYAENQLILAEADTRVNGFNAGLPHLNALRAWLDGGGRLNDAFDNPADYQYDAYVAADFAPGGMENQDNINDTRALLREIIEERYVSGFNTYMPFNDARRLRSTSEGDIAVDYVLVGGPNPPFPERLPYSDEELNANENSPEQDPGLFEPTPVNQ